MLTSSRGAQSLRAEFNFGGALDFREAYDFLMERSPAAGLRFFNETLAAYSRLVAFPDLGSPYMGGTRRLLLTEFPYFLVYTIDRGLVLVLAVAHTSREPGYWLDR